MGGCCCCCSKKPADVVTSVPAYYHYPRALEERIPLTPHVTASPLSTAILVDTNLDTSIPDAYRAPPVPTPFEGTRIHPQTPITTQATNPLDTTAGNDLKESNCKEQKNYELANKEEVEFSKAVKPVEEEDGCPICLEEYDEENPKLMTKCDHHFHLACILEWMERSDTCPVCDKKLEFDPPID